VASRVGHVDAAGQDRDRHTLGSQRPAMRRRVNTIGSNVRYRFSSYAHHSTMGGKPVSFHSPKR
jgi:hypothetical protein